MLHQCSIERGSRSDVTSKFDAVSHLRKVVHVDQQWIATDIRILEVGIYFVTKCLSVKR